MKNEIESICISLLLILLFIQYSNCNRFKTLLRGLHKQDISGWNC